MLIEQTIQRNASPVRQVEPNISAQTASNSQDVAVVRESRKPSLFDSGLEDYQHTVVVGEQCIKITGQSLELVQVKGYTLFHFRSSYKIMCIWYRLPSWFWMSTLLALQL